MGTRETNKKIKVAIFGAGQMAMHHVKAVSFQKNARLVAIADPIIERIKDRLDLPTGTLSFSDPKRLLADMNPDIVHICTPPHTHYQLSLLALQYNANIYVEKPFTLSTEDAKKVISLADEKGLRVCAGHQLLFEGPAMKAGKYISKIGKIVNVESYFSFNPVEGTGDGRVAPKHLDQLIDILPHPVYILLHFMKLPKDEGKEGPVKIRSIHVGTRGMVNGLFHYRDVTGNLIVSLEGRPVESYLKIRGTNGSLQADFIRGTTIVHAGPGTSGISKVLNPYSQSIQLFTGTTISLIRRVLRKQKSYPGLAEIIEAYYQEILSGGRRVISGESIIETVNLCEEMIKRLMKADTREEFLAEKGLIKAVSGLTPVDSRRGGVLITGGTGFLGRSVARELRGNGWLTRVASRRIPPASLRIPGVEYLLWDLNGDIPEGAMKGITSVVHCAAETFGGKEAHSRNSIDATRLLTQAMKEAGVKKLIHISSIAVLKTSFEMGSPVDENTPLVSNSEGRGPYIWGKSESEKLAVKLCRDFDIDICVLRPGALVDYDKFEAPGKLGREVGPLFVCIGKRKDRMGLFEVSKAAKVISFYLEGADDLPPVLNLVDPDVPTYKELLSRLKRVRPDLRIVYFPRVLLRVMSPALKLLQRLLRPGHAPIDLYAVFAPEEYKNELINKILKRLDTEKDSS